MATSDEVQVQLLATQLVLLNQIQQIATNNALSAKTADLASAYAAISSAAEPRRGPGESDGSFIG